MSFTPETLAEEMRKRGDLWADLEAAAQAMEDTKHSILAECMADWPEDSNAAAETKARRDPRYKKHVLDMVEARRKANRAKVAYDVIRSYEGLSRTTEATKRAEMNLK